MGSTGIAPPFATWALDGGEWSTSRPLRFTRGAVTPMRIALETGLDLEQAWALWRGEKHLVSARNRTRVFGHPASGLVAIPTELSRFPLPS
jgi:hypothetical protein